MHRGEVPKVDLRDDLGLRAILPFGNRMEPIAGYSNPRAKSAVYLHYTFFEEGEEFSSAGSGVFIAPNIMLTVAHNVVNYRDGRAFTFKDNLTMYAYIGDTYNFPVGFFRGNEQTVPSSRVPFTLQLGKNTFLRDNVIGNTTFADLAGSTDIAVVVFDRPVQLMVPGAAPRPIVEQPVSLDNMFGTKIYSTGYPFTGQPASGVLREAVGIIPADNLYDNSGQVKRDGLFPITTDSRGGNSGGGIFNDNNEVIGSNSCEYYTNEADDPP